MIDLLTHLGVWSLANIQPPYVQYILKLQQQVKVVVKSTFFFDLYLQIYKTYLQYMYNKYLLSMHRLGDI